MKRNRKKILLVLMVILLCCTPVKLSVKDGGTKHYEALLWGVTKYHSMWQQDGQDGYLVGTSVRVLWFTVYDDFPQEFVNGETRERGGDYDCKRIRETFYPTVYCESQAGQAAI